MNKKHYKYKNKSLKKIKKYSIEGTSLFLWFKLKLIIILVITMVFIFIAGFIYISEQGGTNELIEKIPQNLTKKTIVLSSRIIPLSTSLKSQNNHRDLSLTNTPSRNIDIPLSTLPSDHLINPIVSNIKDVIRDNNKVCRLPQESHVDKREKAKLSFHSWLKTFKEEALNYGIGEDVINSAFQGVHTIEKVIKLDRRQSEYSMTFAQYLRNGISTKRIATGKKMLQKYKITLATIEEKFGVQPQILIAFWAMESNFGTNMGDFPTISTLATLAYDGRRSDFFHDELLCALLVIENGHVTAKQMKSSWAGAMGQPQFMPSTFFYYGSDGNDDGKLNIWKDKDDIFASSANYLKKIGWNAKEPWGIEIKLPKTFDPYIAKFTEEKSMKEWESLGIKQANGSLLSIEKNIQGAIVLPSGIKGPAFLVFNNFKMIRKWNRSINYALTIGHLSDRFIGKKILLSQGPKGEKPLLRKNAKILQENLKKMEFYKGNIDGMIGLKSREAIRDYQKNKGIVADGYPSILLINLVQKDVDNNF